MSRVKRKQINAKMAQGKWTVAVALPAADVLDVSALFPGKTPGGSSTVVGVLTTAPNNRIDLRLAATGKAVASVDGKQVYGRLTEDTGTWYLDFFTMVGGVDTPFDFTGHASVGANVHLRYNEVVEFADLDPLASVNYGEGIDEVTFQASVLGYSRVVEDVTVTTDGQTDFTLTNTPYAPTVGNTEMLVNGVTANYGAEFTVTGTTLTWLNTSYPLDTTDEIVVAVYQ